MYRTKDFQLNSEYMKDWTLQLDGNLGKYKFKKKNGCDCDDTILIDAI